MKKIRISGVEGYYYIEEDTLIYSCDDYADDVEVSDLTDLTIYQYNSLAKQINKQYPKYEIDKLEGRFI